VGEGESGEQSDLDRRAEIRSAPIKSKSLDLGRTPEIQQPVVGHERGGATRSQNAAERSRGGANLLR
jgi:hypothetical protein